jgi:enoyl-CoA hydratase
VSDDLVLTERQGEVLVITLDRPARRNAVDRAMADQLSAAFDLLDDDPALRVGVLAATGPVFCAGTDLAEPASPATERGGEYGLVRRDRRTPLIAALEGPALGGGFEILLACDLVVASSAASFSLPEALRGLVPACGGLFRPFERLPGALVMELLLTGDPLDAAAAAGHGLVNRLVEPGEALDAALGLAERLLRCSPAALEATLAAVAGVRRGAERTGWDTTATAVAAMVGHPEREEGVAAFFDKRPPRWVPATEN